MDFPPAFGPVIIMLFLLSNLISFLTILFLSIFGCFNPIIFIYGSFVSLIVSLKFGYIKLYSFFNKYN